MTCQNSTGRTGHIVEPHALDFLNYTHEIRPCTSTSIAKPAQRSGAVLTVSKQLRTCFVHDSVMAQQPSAAAPAMTSRPKRVPAGDEEASVTLRLGEFQNVPSLNLSEARTIINAVVTRRRNIKQKISESETLLKTQEYLELFARFKQQEHVTAVEQLLGQRTELERFERSQLGESDVMWAQAVARQRIDHTFMIPQLTFAQAVYVRTLQRRPKHSYLHWKARFRTMSCKSC